MATRIVHINNTSMEIVFQGGLQKAPPLNRRGRKKWRERFFILRANRTFEFYKSKKAAEAGKSPRRVMDLRECINLEVGLEYKNYQYVVCLATFKRIFFFAAPSDLVMFQWSTYLEKVKNAQDGESIEVLDIGLRGKGGASTVQSVRPSAVTRAFSSSRSGGNLTAKQRSRSAIALVHFKEGSTATMDLRGEGGGDHSHQGSPVLSPITPTSDRSFKSDGSGEEGMSHHQRFPSISSEYSSSSRSSSLTKSGSMMHIHTTAIPDNTSDMSRVTRVRSVSSDLRLLVLPAKIPPPKEMALKKAARNKDGFFISVNDRKEYQDSLTGSELSSTEDDKIQHAIGNENAMFVPREGMLKRTAGIKKASPKLNNKRLMILRKGQDSSAQSSLTSHDIVNDNFSYNDNMKRSFRYKKFNLRPPEKPLYADSVITDSEDEGDLERESRYSSMSSVPGPSTGGREGESSDTSLLDVSTDSQHDDSFNRSAGSRSGDEVVLRNGSFSSSNSTAVTKSVLGRFNFLCQPPHSAAVSSHKKVVTTLYQPPGRHSLANTYSRVTVLGSKEDSIGATLSQDFSVPKRKPCQRQRSNSQPAIALFRRNLSNTERDKENTITDHQSAALRAIKNSWNLDNELSTSLPLETDMISPSNLPARPSSEMFNDIASQNSMEDLVIPPPAVFQAGEEDLAEDLHSENTTFQLDSPCTKAKLSRTQNVSKTKLFVEEPSDSREDGVKANKKGGVASEEGGAVSTLSSDHHQQKDHRSETEVNRNSTDSNDTGYTSTSPGYQSVAHAQVQQKNLRSHDQILAVEVQGASKPSQIQQAKIPVKDLCGGFSECCRDDFSAGISPEGRSTPVMDARHDELRVGGAGGGALRSYSSSHSLASTCSDMSRMYVPLVFHSPRPLGNVGVTRRDPNLFCIQVCLIENSEDLVREVVSMKSLESYTPVEMEEVEGEGGVVTSDVDDFTVETSLEDLEFGFSIINSTQKDIFSKKVRQFTYEIRNLFGSRKPFSCDVEIRHGNQQTVLSIEVE